MTTPPVTTPPVTTTYFVVPAGIDDPAHPSGGNTYDRRVCRGLQALGWTVVEIGVPGSWPSADLAARSSLAQRISAVPDESVLLIDGLIASASAELLATAAQRLRLVVLMHMPLGANGADHPEEAVVLRAAAAIIATSGWTRDLLVRLYSLSPQRVQVASPGVDQAVPAAGSAAGDQLMCVAVVASHKGQDLLIDALAEVTDLDWRCRLVGALDLDPAFTAGLRSRVREAGLGDRLQLCGPLTGADLEAAYAEADVVVLASHAETYGMVITEALARAIPVIATNVGGVAAALGAGLRGRSPGMLIPAGDVAALTAALRRWLTEPGLRKQLRTAALQRRASLTGWAVTSTTIAGVLAGVAR